MRILVTGATSMIALAVQRRLLLAGHEIVAVARRRTDRLDALSSLGTVETVLCDMQDYGSLADRVHGTVDAAFLTAWNGTRGADRNDAQMQLDNYTNNMGLLPELVKLGCKKVMTAGSQAEYGNWTSERKIQESDTPNPNTEYGKQKLHFYTDCGVFCRENGIVLIEPRFFSLYGPDDYSGTLIMSMLKKMLENQPCEMTQCIQQWDYLYIDDAASGLEMLLTQEVPSGVYNFGSGDSFPLKHFVNEMYRVTGSASDLRFGSVPYPKTGMVNLNPDVSKLKSIGWEPAVSFEQGLKQILPRLKQRTEEHLGG